MAERWIELQNLVCSSREIMLRAERELWKHPQTGFKEWYAHQYLKQIYEGMGFMPVEAGNIPGFYFDINTGRPGPKVCLMGEMDSLIVSDHPECDPQTGAVHACGHHCQGAAIIGAVTALKCPDILKDLCGSVRIMAVPAEELLELEYRTALQRQGIIHSQGGKAEFMYRGYFDSVDMAIMVHTSLGNEPRMRFSDGGNGCIEKIIRYKGRAAHAGGNPEEGINALYAAQLGLSAVNALRETFVDDEHIRTHHIITKGGEAVNTIPATVELESKVRAADLDSLLRVSRQINRAFASGALAMGARLEIAEMHGYMPIVIDSGLKHLGQEISSELFDIPFTETQRFWGTGCSDIGDLSCIMPVISPFCSGATGITTKKPNIRFTLSSSWMNERSN